jgi:membrane peptidoglycan carboxypeptidase
MLNFASGGMYEPGSTFKIITISSAFEEGDATPDEPVDCQHGVINVAGHTIHDWKAFGVLTVKQAFENSSDVCAIKLALRVGDQALYRYIRAFGFGTPTGVELPGEARGMVRPPERWWKASIGAIAMGQEVSVTPLQMVAAASAIANDGVWVRPRIVRESAATPPDQRPAVVSANAIEGRRVVSPQTAARMQRLMEGVVAEGTGKTARPQGYTAAGKTGTAQKLDTATGRYSAHNFVASFVGFTPAESPQFTMIVVLDSPRGKYHGGEVAGPVFRKIAEQALAYRNVLPSDPRQLLAAGRGQTPRPVPAPPVDLRDVSSDASQFVKAAPGLIVPNFVGQGIREVTARALRGRLPIEIEGNGIAYEQDPLPGVPLPDGEKITIRFRIGGLAKPVVEMPKEMPKPAAPASSPAVLPSSAALALPAAG